MMDIVYEASYNEFHAHHHLCCVNWDTSEGIET